MDDLLDNVLCVSKRNGWRGDKQQFTCSVHGESNPSCGVNLDFSPEYGKHYQTVHCFSCGFSGSIPWLLFKSLPDKFRNFRSAEEFLKDRYGVSYSYAYKDGVISIRRYDEDEEEEKHLLPRLVLPLSKLAPFKSGKETYQYFFNRGFNKSDMQKYMIGRDLNSQTVTIPVFWEDKKLAGIIGRYIDPNRPKNMRYKIYEFPKGSIIYPLDKLKVSYDTMILVESMFDVMMMNKWGYDNVVACMGNGLSKDQARMIAQRCKNLIVLFDSDVRGQDAIASVRKVLKDKVTVLTPAFFPEKGKDPCEWGEDNTRSVVSSASLIAPIARM